MFTPNQILPITDFRRNAGKYLDKLDSLKKLILVRGGKPVAELRTLSMEEPENPETILFKIAAFSQGFSSGAKFSTKKMKKILLGQYDRVLPRRIIPSTPRLKKSPSVPATLTISLLFLKIKLTHSPLSTQTSKRSSPVKFLLNQINEHVAFR